VLIRCLVRRKPLPHGRFDEGSGKHEVAGVGNAIREGQLHSAVLLLESHEVGGTRRRIQLAGPGFRHFRKVHIQRLGDGLSQVVWPSEGVAGLLFHQRCAELVDPRHVAIH